LVGGTRELVVPLIESGNKGASLGDPA